LNKNYIFALTPLLLALTLRLYPYLTTGMPFAIDAWAPIRNTEQLIQHTPIDLNDNVFDGYNNYWPANTLFGAIFSEVTLLQPLQAMAIAMPLIGATTTLIFYALVKKMYNTKIAFIASLIFATAFTHAFFTAGVTKETYANPIYMTLILIFLHPTMAKQKQLLLFATASVALALTHHLTAIVTITVLSSIALAQLINNSRKGLPSNKFDFALLGILGTSVLVDFALYAYRGISLTLTYSDWLSMASYQILAFAIAVYLTSRPSTHSTKRTIVISLGALVFGFFFTLLLIKRPFVSGLPVMPDHYLLYDSPYILIPALVALGYGYKKESKALIVPIFWLATIAALEAYAIFGNTILSILLVNRALNFLYPPMAIFAAAGLYRLYKSQQKPPLRRIMKLTVAATIIFMVAVNAYNMYAAISLQERYLGYACLYRVEEYQAGKWIAATNNNLTVSGDWKSYHLLQDYFLVKSEPTQALLYLNGKTNPQPQILFIYDQMQKNGYLISYQVFDLSTDWLEKASELNLIYANGGATLYTQSERGT